MPLPAAASSSESSGVCNPYLGIGGLNRNVRVVWAGKGLYGVGDPVCGILA
jgi:hypothetical protein